jgi:hypothetical protein
MKLFPCMLSMRLDVHKKLLKFRRTLSIRENLLGVCSVWDEIISMYAQCAIKMQISTMSKRNLKKPSRSLANRTKVNLPRLRLFSKEKREITAT